MCPAQANWVSPFATLLGLASQADAALLTTVYYSSFALTRLLAAPLSRRVAPHTILYTALSGAMAWGCGGHVWMECDGGER